MLEEINQRLAQAGEQKHKKQKYERDLQQVQRSLESKSGLLAKLEQQLHKEQVDVDRLEGFSLAGLFYSVLGSRDQQVEKERQELLAAQLKYQQARREVEALRADQDMLERRLFELRGAEGAYAALLAQKEDLLRQRQPRLASQLLNLDESVASRAAEQREIDEALAAASAVAAELEKVISALQSAEGWGAWDLLGGGMLSTAIKHSHIDEARDAAQAAQVQMGRFTRELADVQRSADLRIEIDAFDSFGDYFFDGLIMDWIVQSKIEDSLTRSRAALEHIRRVMDKLERLKRDAASQAQDLSEQRAGLIEQA